MVDLFIVTWKCFKEKFSLFSKNVITRCSSLSTAESWQPFLKCVFYYFRSSLLWIHMSCFFNFRSQPLTKYKRPCISVFPAIHVHKNTNYLNIKHRSRFSINFFLKIHPEKWINIDTVNGFHYRSFKINFATYSFFSNWIFNYFNREWFQKYP